MQRVALGAFIWSAALALAFHWLFYVLPLRGDGRDSARLVAGYWERLTHLHTDVTVELAASVVVGVVAISLTLFVAVSISPRYPSSGAARQARPILLDTVAFTTLFVTAVICWAAIPYLNLGDPKGWPGAAMLAALSMLVSWLAALSEPSVVRYEFARAQAGGHGQQLERTLRSRVGDGSLPEVAGTWWRQWWPVVGWALALALAVVGCLWLLSPGASGHPGSADYSSL